VNGVNASAMRKRKWTTIFIATPLEGLSVGY